MKCSLAFALDFTQIHMVTGKRSFATTWNQELSLVRIFSFCILVPIKLMSEKTFTPGKEVKNVFPLSDCGFRWLRSWREIEMRTCQQWFVPHLIRAMITTCLLLIALLTLLSLGTLFILLTLLTLLTLITLLKRLTLLTLITLLKQLTLLTWSKQWSQLVCFSSHF